MLRYTYAILKSEAGQKFAFYRNSQTSCESTSTKGKFLKIKKNEEIRYFHRNVKKLLEELVSNIVLTIKGLEIFRYHGIAHLPVEFLNHGVVGELVRHKESRADITAIRVLNK